MHPVRNILGYTSKERWWAIAAQPRVPGRQSGAKDICQPSK
jgi:hypothetical protein